MNQDRKRVLEMVAQGKISVDEAERLIEALSKEKSDESAQEESPNVTSANKNLKYLRVLVDSPDGDNVNVRIPVALLKAGLKLSALIPQQAYQAMNKKMAQSGVDIDLNMMLRSGDIEQIIESLGDLNVDVNSAEGEKVKVFFE